MKTCSSAGLRWGQAVITSWKFSVLWNRAVHRKGAAAEMHMASRAAPDVSSCGSPRMDHMRARILFAFFAVGIGILLAHALPAQHHRIGPADIYPDPVRTPGAANPQVTQRNIKDNMCSSHWSTKLIRPPSEYTSKLKRRQLREYGDTIHQERAELVNPSTGKVDTTGAWRVPTTWRATRRTTSFPSKTAATPWTRGTSGPSHTTRTWAAKSWR